MEGIWPGHRGYTPTLYEKCHGIFNDHRESGPRFNVSSERQISSFVFFVKNVGNIPIDFHLYEFQFPSTSTVWWKNLYDEVNRLPTFFKMYSAEERMALAYMFVMTLRVNDDRIFIFGWTVLLSHSNKWILPVPRAVRSGSVNLQLHSFSTLSFPTCCRWAVRAFKEPPTRSFQDKSITSSWARNGSNVAEVTSKQ